MNFFSHRSIAFLFSLFILLTSIQAPAATAPKEKKIRVGFLLSTMQEERYQKDKKFFEDEATKLGAETLFYSANNSERVQVKKMENLLTKNVDVVVVQPVNSDAASALVPEYCLDSRRSKN